MQLKIVTCISLAISLLCVQKRVEGRCPSDQFECANGKCISASYRCNTRYDCKDGSDEIGCTVEGKCASDQFECANGKCIRASYRCDNDNDCGDESDEIGCTGESTCASDQFQCANGNCIRASYRCDNDNDCGDESDEIGCTDFCKIRDINISNAEYESCYTDELLPVGYELLITCNEGYILIGASNLTCLSDNTWSDQPKCVPGCPHPRTIPHATLIYLKEAYPLGSRLIYICNDGYITTTQRRSHSHIVCGSDGKWLPKHRRCVLENEHKLETLEVEVGHSINLPCIPKENFEFLSDTEEEETYLWLRNSQAITYTSTNYFIGANGTLLINNVIEDSVGQYICFQNGQQLNPALIGYDLRLKPSVCPQDGNTYEKVTFLEGSPAVLKCPHTTSDHDFTWFKDGQPYYLREDEVLFPDGSLYMKNLNFFNLGIYACQMRHKDTHCKRNHTIEVQVRATRNHVCGHHDPRYPSPWTVSLWQNDEIAPFCYGALIHESWVITSAYCLAGFNRKRKLDMFVRLTYTDQNRLIDNLYDDDSIKVEVQSVKTHPEFSKKLYVNDIGLVQLKNPVNFTRSVRCICLTESDLTLKQPCDRTPLLNGIVVGWGPLEKNNYAAVSMINESMAIESTSDCFASSRLYSNKMFCAKKANETKTTFAGDAGSPFQILWKKQYYLLGIYSWGERAALLGEYDYFTKIRDYIEWIKSFVDSERKPSATKLNVDTPIPH